MRQRALSVSWISRNSALAMHAVGIDLRDPIDIDPVSLLDGQWMIRGFQLDIGADAVIPQMSTGLKILGAGIEGELDGEPSKEWANMRPVVHVEACDELVEMVLTEGDPDAPDEGRRFPVHMDFQATPHEEVLLIDNTGIGPQGTPTIALFRWYRIEIQRCSGAECGHALVPLVAGGAFESEHRVSGDFEVIDRDVVENSIAVSLAA